MALRDIFKRKLKKEKKSTQSSVRVEKDEKKEEVKVEKPAETKTPKTKKEIKPGESFRILKTPHVAEKATELTEKNQYVFKVWSTSNKPEIKRAVRDVFGVDVVSVRIINVPRKKRRLGKTEGFRKGYKKAIVRIKEGQKIEVLPR